MEGEWEHPEDISQLAGSKVLLKGLVKHAEMRCMLTVWPTINSANCFHSALNAGLSLILFSATYLPQNARKKNHVNKLKLF